MKTIFTILAVLSLSALNAQEIFFVHVAKASNMSSNATIIDNPLTNGQPNINLIVSHCWDCNENIGMDNNKVSGVFYDQNLSKWMIYNEDLSYMIENTAYFVYVASNDYSFRYEIGTSPGTYYSIFSNPITDGMPNNAMVTTNVYQSTYNNANSGFFYDASLSKWAIFDEGYNNIPSDANYSIAVGGEPGIDSYIHTSTAETLSGECTRLDHPSLDGKPDSKMVFTHLYNESGIFIDIPLTAYYNNPSGKWFLCNEDLSAMPVEVSFSILIKEGTAMGVEDFDATAKITVFPNPMFDMVDFNSPNTIEKISIYDLTGKQVLTQKQSGKTIELNVSALPSGVYIAKVKTNKGAETVKLIKK